MVFSDVFFLFAFLPLVLAVYYALPGMRWKNAWLLVASGVFYTWGELAYAPVLLTAIVIAFACGRLAAKAPPRRRGAWLAGGVCLLVLHLVVYKYAGFLVANGNALLGTALPVPQLRLPLGISFFTFQAISYLVDTWRRPPGRGESFLNVALYIALFPQLIAGPIVRYAWIEASLHARRITVDDVAEGTRRFIVGLAKKVLIADVLGEQVEHIFALPAEDRPMLLAWMGVAAYSLQIYFDFSGYSDMAIGLGRMLGFRFPENFNHPYRADSMTDFWRRWHMTLSSWFRDYVYIPLGGSRHGAWITTRNLFAVFVLCGLWHGASWNFLAWGLLHGVFLSAERVLGARFAWRAPRPLRHAYLLLVVGVSWVVFYHEDFSAMLAYLADLFVPDGDLGLDAVTLYADGLFLAALAAGVAACLPLRPGLADTALVRAGADAALLAMLAACAMFMTASTFSPFIYFRF